MTSEKHSAKYSGICFVALAAAMLASSCSLMLLTDNESFDISFKRTDKILVIVEDQLFVPLSSSLSQYTQDLAADGITAIVRSYSPDTVLALRTYISSSIQEEGIDGVFMIGNFPVAWYEQTFKGRQEEFPCDLYLMDPSSIWQDTDADLIYDTHSGLSLKIFVSRLTGTETETRNYFSKNHRYRTGDLSLPVSAYLFKDDDWRTYQAGSTFGLGRIYTRVETCDLLTDTTRANYIERLHTIGSEFVNQWIHSYPLALAVVENGNYHWIDTSDIAENNPKSLFYNLFDCSAARFTEENLAMAYLTKTDYALAAFGSTKVGGAYNSLAFYDVLSKNGTWGDAYKNWYANFGIRDDEWFLGMVIVGDPALHVSSRGPTYRFIDMELPAEPSVEQLENLKNTFENFLDTSTFEDFKTYKNENPGFFG